ncbi:MAG: sulfite exporter TauE/SafE family protein [Kofleriaceae bacterium]
MLDPGSLALVGGAAIAGGAINAIAGGGSLVTFPTLVALGVPPVAASVTNTVAMCPGYFGATFAQRRDLIGQGRRAAIVLPVGALAGIAGALLLLHTGERAFETVVPFLLLVAALLVAVQEPLRRRLFGRVASHHADAWAALPVAAAGVYGGYFGAGLGVMILAALAIVLADSIVRINALKQAVSLSVNVSAAIAFIPSGKIHWPSVAVMAIGALAGGAIGGRIASRISARALRWTVAVLGTGLAVVYFVR